MSTEQPLPSNYIEQNQEHWRNANRGIFSRPLELPRTGKFLHERIVRTFGLEHIQEPIVTWSAIFDKPKSPSSAYVYAERFPEGVAKEDKHDFSVGIGRITEYATNIATKDFIDRNTDILVVNAAARAYAAFGDLATYGIMLAGTYREMARIEYMAEQNGEDFRQALYRGLFQHDTAPLNELIANTKEFSGCSDINELAIKLGKKRFKRPDIGKWLDKLEVERTDGSVKAGIKNCAVSVLAGGVFRSPGIIEVSGGFLPLFFAETLAIYGLNGRMDIGLLAQNLAVIAATGIIINPFATVHEMIHSYSASEDYMGFIPAELIKKEVTPYFTRLETKE